MIVSVLIILAGYALIFGAGKFAERALRTAAGLALILSVLPGLLGEVEQVLSGVDGQSNARALAWLEDAGLILLLGGVGLFAWRSREVWARRREAKRVTTPRERALPSPPDDTTSEGGEVS